MPWTELTTRTATALAGVTLLLVLYTHALFLIGRNLRGVAKLAVSLALYVLVAGGMGVGLIFVFGSASDLAVRQSGSYMVSVLAAWAVVAAPGILYVRKHLPTLRSLGFFQPR